MPMAMGSEEETNLPQTVLLAGKEKDGQELDGLLKLQTGMVAVEVVKHQEVAVETGQQDKDQDQTGEVKEDTLQAAQISST